jgi:hypothetical protein
MVQKELPEKADKPNADLGKNKRGKIRKFNTKKENCKTV